MRSLKTLKFVKERERKRKRKRKRERKKGRKREKKKKEREGEREKEKEKKERRIFYPFDVMNVKTYSSRTCNREFVLSQ
jgi:hypothetical protein